jgi:DNA-binding Lrp family transcriptional regulator
MENLRLDKQDRKLLAALDKNSRASFVSLGKEIGVAPETVRYKVERLVGQGVIKKFYAIIDSGRLGLTLYKTYLTLQSADESKVKEIIQFLVDEESVQMVLRFEGTYDLAFGLKTNSIATLSKFLDSLNKNYRQFIAKKTFGVNLSVQYFPRDYLTSSSRTKGHLIQYSVYGAPYQTDSADNEILKQLLNDSRVSAAKIEQEFNENPKIVVSLSRESIARRIKKLEQDKIITGYTLMLEQEKLAQLNCRALLYLNQASEKKIEQFISRAKENSRVWYVIKALGEWDYELGLEVENIKQYRSIISELTLATPGVLREHKMLIVSETYKYEVFSI